MDGPQENGIMENYVMQHIDDIPEEVRAAQQILPDLDGEMVANQEEPLLPVLAELPDEEPVLANIDINNIVPAPAHNVPNANNAAFHRLNDLLDEMRDNWQRRFRPLLQPALDQERVIIQNGVALVGEVDSDLDSDPDPDQDQDLDQEQEPGPEPEPQVQLPDHDVMELD